MLKEAEVAIVKKSTDAASAKWVKEVPKGSIGYVCTSNTGCVTTGKTPQCCGTSTPTANKAGVTTGQYKMCNTKTLTTYKDKAAASFKFSCKATQLVASAGAILAAAYLM